MTVKAKRIFISITIFLFYGSAFGQKSTLDSVKIDWESFSTETPFNIHCENFEELFLKTRKYKLLIKKNYLKKLDGIRKDIFFKRETEFTSIDVRGEITFYYSKLTVQYCFDQFGHFYNNGAVKNNKALWSSIVKFIPKRDQ